jgi:hypothetical protein
MSTGGWNMKKVVAGILIAGYMVSVFATDARVITMGRHDNFFMDEVSIFKNPANINIYPNMVYGSYGEYRPTASDTGQYAALKRTNRDPSDPFFGSIVSYSLKQNAENRNQYPMFSFGAIFNRRDEILDFITPGTLKYWGGAADIMRSPAGKIDLLAGYVLENGAMLGVGTYLAFQSETEESRVQFETSVYKGSAGVNWPVARSTNLELSVVGGILRALGTDYTGQTDVLIANNRWFLKGDMRLFSALSMINGDFVPHVSAQKVTLGEDGEITYTDIAGGLGLNVNIDKGFFWAGVEGLYKDYVNVRDTNTTGIGGRVSFGIERSIMRDWFVIRVGGQKILFLTEKISRGITRSMWEENIAADASDNDLVSLGFGLNVENRLRIDFVAAEDLAYTFTNLFSGPQHHLFTRVSATYSF